MTPEPAGVMPMADARERADAIRSAVEREFEPIARAVGAMVHSVERGRDREWLRQRTEDVVAEAICRALERPGFYDPGRPAVSWIVGIARNVMKGEARVASRADAVGPISTKTAFESVLGVIDTTSGQIHRISSRSSGCSRGSHPGIGRRSSVKYLQGLGGE